MVGRVRPIPMWQRAVILLSGTVVGLVVVLGLQGGRLVLIPVALAALLTFLLNPFVRALEQRGLGRIFAVTVAVSTTSIILITMGWMVTWQVAGMLAELPQNTTNIKAKLNTLRALSSSPWADRFGQMIEDIQQQAPLPTIVKSTIEVEERTIAGVSVKPPAKSVIFRTESIPWLSLTGYLSSAFEVLVTLGFALVLLVFFLLGREDLRDRIVMLAGKARLTITSKALEDATNRISRYIVMVVLVRMAVLEYS